MTDPLRQAAEQLKAEAHRVRHAGLPGVLGTCIDDLVKVLDATPKTSDWEYRVRNWLGCAVTNCGGDEDRLTPAFMRDAAEDLHRWCARPTPDSALREQIADLAIEITQAYDDGAELTVDRGREQIRELCRTALAADQPEEQEDAKLDRAVTTVVGTLQAGAAGGGISERSCFNLAKLLNDAREDSE